MRCLCWAGFAKEEDSDVEDTFADARLEFMQLVFLYGFPLSLHFECFILIMLMILDSKLFICISAINFKSYIIFSLFDSIWNNYISKIKSMNHEDEPKYKVVEIQKLHPK